MLPSGKQTTIANRIHWARSYMKQAGLVRNIRRGWFELTDRGRSVLDDPTISVNSKYLEQFDEFQEFKSRGKENNEKISVREDTETTANTPDENLQTAHKRLEAALAANLIDYVRSGFVHVLRTPDCGFANCDGVRWHIQRRWALARAIG